MACAERGLNKEFAGEIRITGTTGEGSSQQCDTEDQGRVGRRSLQNAGRAEGIRGGSADFDDRSSRLNDEADLDIFQRRAREEFCHVGADIRKSKAHGIATVGAPLEQWANLEAARAASAVAAVRDCNETEDASAFWNLSRHKERHPPCASKL
jgi:hypothetical protein